MFVKMVNQEYLLVYRLAGSQMARNTGLFLLVFDIALCTV